MKKCTGVLVILLIASQLFADVDRLRVFQKAFLRASLTTKIQVLQDAADEVDVDMGPLFLQALDFSLANTPILRDDLIARELSILSVRLVGIGGYREALDSLWKLFELDNNRSVRIEVLNAIAEMPPADPDIVSEMNSWVLAQNAAYKNDEAVDLVVVSEAAVTLGTLGDESSFPVLFSMGTSGYPDSVTQKAQTALFQIAGDFSRLIIQVLDSNPMVEKLEAFRLAMDNDELNDATKANIAEIALDRALAATLRNATDRDLQRKLRYESVRVLADYGWSTATSDIIEHFNLVIEERRSGIGDNEYLIEAIDALGATGTLEAAQRLALYQDVLNGDYENDKDVDEQVVLAVIQNIGTLGYLATFDALFYARYLEYPEQITRSIIDAMDKLNKI